MNVNNSISDLDSNIEHVNSNQNKNKRKKYTGHQKRIHKHGKEKKRIKKQQFLERKEMEKK